MKKNITLKLLPEEAYNDTSLKEILATTLSVPKNSVSGWNILKRSIDARGKTIWVNISLLVFINEPYEVRPKMHFHFKNVSESKKKVIIIGGGPAGLFAAIYLIQMGIKPIILERGKDVRSRRRDLALLNKEGILNTESNYCFGEGGAGTYSDGKLYTRSKKRGDIERILNLFVHFGADENILYESHPHIGTNKLPSIIASIREMILLYGGKFEFNKKVVDLKIEKDIITSVQTEDGDEFSGDHFISATGHSAGDIYELLHSKKVLLFAKPFALGVRIEHPQDMIDHIQYYGGSRNVLPPASYSLVQQIGNKGVFSFCMCPGGIIAPASTSARELVVNGWSPSKRNNPFANSGIVVQVEEKDVLQYFTSIERNTINKDPLLLYKFQKHIEQIAYKSGGGSYRAPAQRMVDFVNNKISGSLPVCSYKPGLTSVNMRSVLPNFISNPLSEAFKIFGKKMAPRTAGSGFLTNEAVIVGVESRTSSSVKIPRNEHTLNHPQLKNFFPCGEGAGFAGGIVSAAMDGEKVANIISKILHS